MTARPTCLLCLWPIEPDEGTSEHLVPAALGGALQVPGLIHRSCNSSLGNAVDVLLHNVFAPTLALFNIHNAREKTPPPLRFTRDGQEWMWFPHKNRLTLARPYHEPREDGWRTLLPTGNDRLRKQQEKGVRRLTRDLPDEHEVRFSWRMETMEGFPIPSELELFGGRHPAARAVANIALMCAGHAFGPAFALRLELDDLSNFVGGCGFSRVEAFPEGSKAFIQVLGLNAPDQAVVLDPREGEVNAAIVLFGTFVYRVCLGPATPGLRPWARRFDPRQPSVHGLDAPPVPRGRSHETEWQAASSRYQAAVTIEAARRYVERLMKQEGKTREPLLDPRSPIQLAQELAQLMPPEDQAE